MASAASPGWKSLEFGVDTREPHIHLLHEGRRFPVAQLGKPVRGVFPVEFLHTARRVTRKTAEQLRSVKRSLSGFLARIGTIDGWERALARCHPSRNHRSRVHWRYVEPPPPPPPPVVKVRTRRSRREEPEEAGQKFGTMLEAFRFAAEILIPNRHSFIVNVLGPREAELQHACTLQVLASHMVLGDHRFGLTVHLTFGPTARGFAEYVAFRHMDGNGLFQDRTWQGIPCFAYSFGRNYRLAARVCRRLLEEVYDYGPRTRFVCTVFDEG